MGAETRTRIAIPGGSGQIGTALARYFHAQGHEVTVLSRSPRAAPWRTLAWDGRTLGAWVDALDGCDAWINLAGRSVNCRYNLRNRAEILDSRVGPTRVLHQALRTVARHPRVWLNASTATIYRHALDRPMDEAAGELGGAEPGAPAMWRFSIEVAKAWEAAFFSEQPGQTRMVALRSAMTFTPDRGGVFDVLSRLVRLGLGGSQGDGSQWVSWIHEMDFLRAVEWILADERLNGAINLASPHPLPNRDFMRGLRQAWGVSIGLPATKSMIEIGTFLMRSESELVLKSRRVVPGKLADAGFAFTYGEWGEAARELVARWKGKSFAGKNGMPEL